jgi:hypothetical protein
VNGGLAAVAELVEEPPLGECGHRDQQYDRKGHETRPGRRPARESHHHASYAERMMKSAYI